jgi:kynurenine 3-monooxygenase
MPNLIEDYQANPVGSLVTVRLNPWYKGRIVVLGDAAHAVVPFYGQGMNAAFEDALRLYMHVKENVDILRAAKHFAEERVPATNALADLSFQNYTEMAHHTASSLFLIRKRIEGWLNYFFPSSWIPQYSMVSFTTIPYHVVVQRARRQDKAIKAGVYIAGLLASVGAGVGAWYFRKRLRL